MIENTNFGKVEKRLPYASTRDKKDIIYSEMISELKEVLQSYLDKNPNISANGFCARNSLSSTTIHYLLTGVTKKKISAEVVRKIVFGVYRGNTIKDILQNTKGQLGKFLRKSFEGLETVNFEAIISPIKESYLQTREGRIITVLAYNKGGTTKSEIANTLDSFALEVLDKMLKDKILVKDETGRITGQHQNQYIDNTITKKMISDLAYYLKPTEVDKGLNQFKTLCGKLSSEKRRRQKEIMKNAIDELTKLYSEEDENGEHSFFILGSDTLTQPEISTGEEQ